MIQLILTLREMRAMLRATQEPGGQGGVQRVALHLSRFSEGTEFLAHAGSTLDAEGTLLAWPADNAEVSFPEEWTQSLRREPTRPFVGLAVGVGAQQGNVAGVVRLDPEQAPVPLDGVRIVGPQMPTLPLTGTTTRVFRPLWVTANGLYSRQIGTVGLRTFARLQHARIAIIGAGGNGSLMAEQLARWMGKDGRLGLFDPDRIELFNLPAWGGAGGQDAPSLLGRSKVEALAEYLRTLPDAPEIEPVAASVLDWTALTALKRYDLFVSCVDNPTARYAATFLATLYLRPLLDVATGVYLGSNRAEHVAKIVQEEGPTDSNQESLHKGRLPYSLFDAGLRTMGADVRLTFPGSGEQAGNCLFCMGGVGDLEAVRKELASPTGSGKSPSRSVSFWKERAGSLSLLNSDAVNQGMRMLIAFLEGSLSVGRHWQMDQTLTTPPHWRQMDSTVQACPVCGLLGRGDSAIGNFSKTILEFPRNTP